MSISSRVRSDDKIEEAHKGYLIARVGKSFRVYSDATEYSSVSGQNIKRGRVLRATSDNPVTFTTIAAAIAWIDAGLPVVDSKGNELF